MSVLKTYGERDRTTAPSRTFKLERNRISAMTDGKDAVLQAIDLALSTERWRFAIYSPDYGCEIHSLFGSDAHPDSEQVKMMVEEALLQDDRITSIESWSFELKGDRAEISFVAKTIFGDMEIKRGEKLG